MRVTYHPLFRMRVRHSWYANQVTRNDFCVVPSPSTQRQLESLGLQWRENSDGITVLADVEKGDTGYRLARARGHLGLRFQFLVCIANADLFNVTALPPLSLGRQVLCLDNLDVTHQDGRRILGDSVAKRRLGDPVALVCGTTYRHRFSEPVSRAELTLCDRFNRFLGRFIFAAPTSFVTQSEPLLRECSVDLRRVAGLVPGRYVIADDSGKTVPLYYDPELRQSRVLAVLELFNEVRPTPSGAQAGPEATSDDENSSAQVPIANRFLRGDELVNGGDYCLDLPVLATYWRYRISKTYSTNGVGVSGLSIDGPIEFVPSGTVTDGQVAFTSKVPIGLSEISRDLKLKHAETELRTLPNPGLSTPLAREPSEEGSFFSDLFINV